MSFYCMFKVHRHRMALRALTQDIPEAMPRKSKRPIFRSQFSDDDDDELGRGEIYESLRNLSKNKRSKILCENAKELRSTAKLACGHVSNIVFDVCCPGRKPGGEETSRKKVFSNAEVDSAIKAAGKRSPRFPEAKQVLHARKGGSPPVSSERGQRGVHAEFPTMADVHWSRRPIPHSETPSPIPVAELPPFRRVHSASPPSIPSRLPSISPSTVGMQADDGVYVTPIEMQIMNRSAAKYYKVFYVEDDDECETHIEQSGIQEEETKSSPSQPPRATPQASAAVLEVSQSTSTSRLAPVTVHREADPMLTRSMTARSTSPGVLTRSGSKRSTQSLNC